jgi:hypothetical protein
MVKHFIVFHTRVMYTVKVGLGTELRMTNFLTLNF